MIVVYRDGPKKDGARSLNDGTTSFKDESRITTGRYAGMFEVWRYEVRNSEAWLVDHFLDGDVSCVSCGRCRDLDAHGHCNECVEVTHEDDASIVRKNR